MTEVAKWAFGSRLDLLSQGVDVTGLGLRVLRPASNDWLPFSWSSVKL